ncbi:MAG: biopolymer transporter ExbD [Firmicutes bacterium]|nr:biopolymer transporter ExbD [Bacillota bacterium]
MRFQRSKRRLPAINLIPLMDVMTFLIVFFILFTSFKTAPTGLQINLPRAVTAAPYRAGQMIVSIDRTGRLYFNGRRTTIPELRDQIKEHVSRDPGETVIIRADRQVLYEDIIAVMDTARDVGASRIALAADRRPAR